MNDKRMVNIGDMLGLCREMNDKHNTRLNELEHQVEVLREAVKWLVFNDQYTYCSDDLAELKPLVNIGLFGERIYIDGVSG
jgi:hypothetical protein